MVKLANLFFLLFSTPVSPQPLFINSSSMDMEANPNISTVELFKSNTLPTTSFSAHPYRDMEAADVKVKRLRAVNNSMRENTTLLIIFIPIFLIIFVPPMLLLQHHIRQDRHISTGCVDQSTNSMQTVQKGKLPEEIKPSKMEVAPQGCLQIPNKKTTNQIN